jgi:DNA-binding protein H-NS
LLTCLREPSVRASRARESLTYRDDVENTWTGRGSKRRWPAAALSDGKRLEDFAVKS